MEWHKPIDEKHSLIIGKDGWPSVAKRTIDGQLIPVPADEPMILFRGRDKLSLPMLKYYRQLCQDDGATEYQLSSTDKMIEKFTAFAEKSPTMKQPGSTQGK